MVCATITWPLKSGRGNYRPGGFAEQRPAKGTPVRHHAGIDIGAPLDWGRPVVATEAGVVGNRQGWATGTRALLLHTDTGRTIVYGSLQKGSLLPRGTRVQVGDTVAFLGRYPGGKVMLHFEVYDGHQPRNITWAWGEPRPDYVQNPAGYLAAARLQGMFCDAPGDAPGEVIPPETPGPAPIPPPPPAAPLPPPAPWVDVPPVEPWTGGAVSEQTQDLWVALGVLAAAGGLAYALTR